MSFYSVLLATRGLFQIVGNRSGRRDHLRRGLVVLQLEDGTCSILNALGIMRRAVINSLDYSGNERNCDTWVGRWVKR